MEERVGNKEGFVIVWPTSYVNSKKTPYVNSKKGLISYVRVFISH